MSDIQWTTPSPLWSGVGDLSDETRAYFRKPAILRFASDSFMDDFNSVLQSAPEQLKGFRARPESWRGPGTAPHVEPIEQLPPFAQKLIRARIAEQQRAGGSAPMVWKTSTKQEPLKLYQPAHMRHYLISAALVCRVPGMPDRRIETSNQERATFVLRKVTPPANTTIFETDETQWNEYAFVNNSWQKVTNPHSLLLTEEQNPLFAVRYPGNDGRQRRVLAGVIPVGKREVYIGAPERGPNSQIILDPTLPPPPDPRTLLFMAQFTEPWKRLIERAFAWDKAKTASGVPLAEGFSITNDLLKPSIKDNREQMQLISWLALLDFARLLKQHIPNVWAAIMGQPVNPPLNAAQAALVAEVANTRLRAVLSAALLFKDATEPAVVPAKLANSLQEAIQLIEGGLPYDQARAEQIEKNLESHVDAYNRNDTGDMSTWPGFLFPLSDPVYKLPLPPIEAGADEDDDPLTAALDRIDAFTAKLEAALPAQPLATLPAPLLASQPVMDMNTPTYFVIRCVFEQPRCGPLVPPLVSDPTEPFLMAGFFDPDAPARPIRIGMPVDTTPAGLRKFDKNTAFMISDVLCGQITRAKGLGLGDLVMSVLPWPLHKDLDLPDTGPCKDTGFSLGMICSLSIPIITICALILLMIMVSLLDIIFRWMPYFILCLPLPKFSGKQPTS